MISIDFEALGYEINSGGALVKLRDHLGDVCSVSNRFSWIWLGLPLVEFTVRTSDQEMAKSCFNYPSLSLVDFPPIAGAMGRGSSGGMQNRPFWLYFDLWEYSKRIPFIVGKKNHLVFWKFMDFVIFRRANFGPFFKTTFRRTFRVGFFFVRIANHFWRKKIQQLHEQINFW